MSQRAYLDDYSGDTILTSESRKTPVLSNGELVWSLQEDQRLFNTYPGASKELLLTLFPDRSWDSIKTRAHQLKIRRSTSKFNPNSWTDQDIRILVKNYGYVSMGVFLRLWPVRSDAAIRHKARRLGLGSIRAKWSEKEDLILLEGLFNGDSLFDIKDRLPGRSFKAISERLYRLEKMEDGSC